MKIVTLIGLMLILTGLFSTVVRAESVNSTAQPACYGSFDCAFKTVELEYRPYAQMKHFALLGSAWADQYSDPLRLPNTIRQQGVNTFVFSPRHLQWAAYDPTGGLVAYGRANGGSDYCADLGKPCRTPQGRYKVFRRGAADCESNTFPLGEGGAPMPYCMFFRGGYAIHGSPVISMRNASHGCIRVTTDSARWLYEDFISSSTKVVVLSY